MADFNARRDGTFWWSLAILWVMGRLRHFRPLVEMLELAIVGATTGLSAELPVRWSRCQLALTYNAAASIKLAMTAATTERTLSDLDRMRQLHAAIAIAAAVPHLDGKFCHRSRRTGPDLAVDCWSDNSRRASVARSISASVVAPMPNFAASGASVP
jgi:hypothetical protein